MQGLSVIIPTRNEALLGFTVRRLDETRGQVPLEVIVIDDHSAEPAADQLPPAHEGLALVNRRLRGSVGNCFCRDMGISLASHEAVLVLDAHMNFHDHSGWAARVVAHAHERPQDVACTISAQLGPGRMSMADSRGQYFGARVVWRDRDSHGRYRVLPVKWADEGKACLDSDEATEVGCCLGGAYVINRDWYMDGLQRPWRPLRGWGHSEPNLCLPNWLLGGRNVILPVEIGHCYRTGGVAPYRTFHHHLLHNQIWLLEVLPLSDRERLSGRAWLRRSKWAKDEIWQQAWREVHAAGDRIAYRRRLQAGPRTWPEYRKRWID